MALQPRRQPSSHSPPSEPQIVPHWLTCNDDTAQQNTMLWFFPEMLRPVLRNPASTSVTKILLGDSGPGPVSDTNCAEPPPPSVSNLSYPASRVSSVPYTRQRSTLKYATITSLRNTRGATNSRKPGVKIHDQMQRRRGTSPVNEKQKNKLKSNYEVCRKILTQLLVSLRCRTETLYTRAHRTYQCAWHE
jgi:hypothetical protein